MMTSILRQAGSTTLNNTYRRKSVNDIQSHIRAEVWRKQIRIKTFFQDYDKLRKGYCIEDKFISALATAMEFLAVSLSTEEVTSLVDKYRMEPGDLVKYSDFIKNIDQQFFDHSFAKTNLTSLSQHQAVSSEEQELLYQLLQYIKWSVSSKRILIKNQLQDFDRTKCSFITRDQFTRVLDSLGLVRNEQLADLLCRKYCRSINPKEIQYLKFISDVESIKLDEATVVKGIVPNPTVIDPHANYAKDLHKDSLTDAFYVEKKIPPKLLPIESVIRKLQAEVTLRRIRIRQFFLDYDGLRKNIVTGEQFKRILNVININLTDTEFNEILKIYNVDGVNTREKRIKWMDFCEDVDAIFTTKGIEKDPLCKVNQIDKSIVEPIKHVPVQFTEEQLCQIDEVMKSYKNVFKTKRLHLKPLFEDYDITKIGYVTKNQFTRLLKQYDLIPNNEQQYNLVLKKYMDKGNLNEVNYYQFIRDIDEYNVDSKVISQSYATSFVGFRKKPRPNNATISNEIPKDLDDLLGRLGRKVKEERIRLSDFLKDFDKLRHGNVSKQQFRLALGMAKLPLSQFEFSLILQHFECPDKAGYIRWKDFTDTIDNVFNQHKLQKVPPNQQVKLASTNFVYTRPQITEEERETAEKIKQEFINFRLANRLEPKQFFENWDKLNRWKISPKQFRQVLATLGFQLTAEQNEAVCKLYITDDGHQVRYLDFLNDTKPYDFSYMTKMKDVPRVGTGDRPEIPKNVGDVLKMIQKTTKINRLRFKEYFKDFDPLNKGTVKKNKFRAVIFQTLKVQLLEEAFDILQSYYTDVDPLMVNYMRFLADVDIVFNLTTQDKDPQVRPPNYDYSVTHFKREEESIDSLMRRLGQVTRKHKLLIKPFFQDKDVAKIGHVSFTRMRSILDNNKLPLSDYQYSLLCANFAYEGKNLTMLISSRL